MIALNLTAKGAEQEIVKKYLEENASEVLADKINNGVRIEKDCKTLISRKTLDGFMKYANEEAKKQAEKGKTCSCVEGIVVIGWAIHYFEEDWQFSAYLVSKGFKVLEVGKDELLIDAGYKKVSEPSSKVLLRGYAKGMPSIQEVTFENRPCKAIAVPNMTYGLFLS